MPLPSSLPNLSVSSSRSSSRSSSAETSATRSARPVRTRAAPPPARDSGAGCAPRGRDDSAIDDDAPKAKRGKAGGATDSDTTDSDSSNSDGDSGGGGDGGGGGASGGGASGGSVSGGSALASPNGSLLSAEQRRFYKQLPLRGNELIRAVVTPAMNVYDICSGTGSVSKAFVSSLSQQPLDEYSFESNGLRPDIAPTLERKCESGEGLHIFEVENDSVFKNEKGHRAPRTFKHVSGDNVYMGNIKVTWMALHSLPRPVTVLPESFRTGW